MDAKSALPSWHFNLHAAKIQISLCPGSQTIQTHKNMHHMAMNLVERLSIYYDHPPQKGSYQINTLIYWKQHFGFSQTVAHPSTNAANCRLTSIVVTLAFYHSANGKRQNSSGDLSSLSCISQCIIMQPFAKQTLYVIGKKLYLVSNFADLTHSPNLTQSPLYKSKPVEWLSP